MFYNVAEDDRSDNDDNELAEEQRLDALAKQGVDKIASKKMVANAPPNGKAITTGLHTDKVTNRKENRKKT